MTHRKNSPKGTLHLINRRNRSLFSARVDKNFKAGKSYVAHYVVKQRGVDVTNILDVVQKPFSLKKTRIKVPFIDPTKRNVKAGYSKSGVDIKANVFHRYPVLVTPETIELDLKVGLSTQSTGRLYVQVYNPDGEEVLFLVSQDSPINTYAMAQSRISTLKEGKVASGVWEITVSSSSSSWLSSSKYDILVESTQFGLSTDKLTLAAGETTEFIVNTKTHSLDHVQLHSLKKTVTEDVQVASGHVSFHPLNLPADFTGVLQFKVEDDKSAYWGNISQKLYVKEGETFLPYAGAVFIASGLFNINAASDKVLYAALDTITNYVDANLKGRTSKTVKLITVMNTQTTLSVNVETKAHEDKGITSLKVTLGKAEEESLSLSASLDLISGSVRSSPKC